jgi:hypothetical protein
MRALVIWIVAGLCACLPGQFDDLGRGTKHGRDAGTAGDAGTGALDAELAADGAAQEPRMDAAADSDSSGADDAASHAEASVEAGANDAAVHQDARVVPPCLPPRMSCEGACIDPRSDSAHCGSCEIACHPGYACVERTCLSELGCSDDTREGFPDLVAFPTIAGCSAAWPLASMRAPRVQGACGNSLSTCSVPAEACALGWHVCGNAANGPADLTARVTSTQCNTTPGRWAGALGDLSCEDCSSATASGSICCGADCVQQNRDCLWPGMTAWFGVVNGVINLCTGTENPQLYPDVGVLCCRDGATGTSTGPKPTGQLF